MINCNLKKNLNNKTCKKAVGEAEFSVVLPKSDNSGNPIKKATLKKYINRMNRVFGGSTTIPTTKGCYFDNKKFFCENGLKIVGVRDFDSKYAPQLKKLNAVERKKMLKKDYKEVKKIGKDAGNELGQDSVMVVSNFINDATFVPGTFKKEVKKGKRGKKEIF